MTTTEMLLRDVIDIPDSVHAGDFKVELSGGFTDSAARVKQYVVTDQLRQAFGKALTVVRAAVRDGNSHAAYLHGSFGSGKSHFMTVLHAVLNNEQFARDKPGLQPVIAVHDDWLGRKKFLMVPYHLVGAADIDSAILGGYVAAIRDRHPDEPTPAVFRADAMLDDARRQRDFFSDDAQFVRWLGETGAPSASDDDLDVIDATPVSSWTSETLDRAFAAPAGDQLRESLVQALLSGPMSSYARGAVGDRDAFLPLEDGLSVISRHAQGLHYDGLVLFLDELILWLQSHMVDQEFVKVQVSKLVKLIESAVADRPIPIVSFVSRQRDLSKLIGEDVTGADVKNLESQVEYLAGRFDVINLEDRNLPAIIKERVLEPKSKAAEQALVEAFQSVESTNADVRDALLDATGATGATWADFRAVYPLSPALLNVLVALSGALQRERTGLKLLQEMLQRRRGDMRLGELIPLGDLWDVLADGTGEAFTDRLRSEADAAQRFHDRVRAYLAEKYGSETHADFVATDRMVKTMLLAFLAPNVSALKRLTGGRLAALNHGSIRSRTVTPGRMVVTRLRELQAEFGELRSEGDADPVFTLHLSDLDIEPLLDAVGEQDTLGARRLWIKDQVWGEFGTADIGQFVCERDVVWKGTRRTVELVYGNVRDRDDLPDVQFRPSVDGRVRLVLDYPFDPTAGHPGADVDRVHQLRRAGIEAATVVWIPHFFSIQKSAQLGRLLKIRHLLTGNRLDDYAVHLTADDRTRVRHQLQAHRDTLSTQLSAALRQLYGIGGGQGGDDTVIGHRVPEDEGHVHSLLPGHRPRLQGGASFDHNLLALTDSAFEVLYPKHPNFDPTTSRKPITTGDLRTALGWITRAVEDGGGRVIVDRPQLALLKRIVHPLELGEVHDGPLTVSSEWRRRIDQYAAQHSITGDYSVDGLRDWIADLGYTGLDKAVSSLIIAVYALLTDRTWVLRGTPETSPPDLSAIGAGYALRAQDLPSPEEFSAARNRADVLFGHHVSDVLRARNVGKLAELVRGTVTDREAAVLAVRRGLDARADELGLTAGSPVPRVETARYAVDLLARLSRTPDATGLLRALAAADYPVTDEVLGAAIMPAPALRDALDATDWEAVSTLRGIAARGDSLGERAAALLTEVRGAADRDEFTVKLAPVLDRLRAAGGALIREAARRRPDPVDEDRRKREEEAAARELAEAAQRLAEIEEKARVERADADRRVREAEERARREREDADRRIQEAEAGRPVASTHGITARVVGPAAIDTQLRQAVQNFRAQLDEFVRENPSVQVEIALDWHVVEERADTA